MAPEKNVKPSPSSIELTAHAQKGPLTCHIKRYNRVDRRRVAEPSRYETRLPSLWAIAAGAGARPASPQEVVIPSGTALAPERFVADDGPELFGGWIIHPEGFRAPRIVEMAKLQAWTLKPAERTASRGESMKVGAAP